MFLRTETFLTFERSFWRFRAMSFVVRVINLNSFLTKKKLEKRMMLPETSKVTAVWYSGDATSLALLISSYKESLLSSLSSVALWTSLSLSL